MPGIKFDITGDNSHFIQSMNEVRDHVSKTNAVISRLSNSFNMDGTIQQIVSLSRAVEENEAPRISLSMAADER